MTQHVRKGYRNHRKATWAAGAVVALALAALTLVLVLPALGAAGDLIPPESHPQLITPTDVPVGGSNFDCTASTGGVPAGLRTFSVPSPPNSATTVTYNSTNTASSPTPLPAGVVFKLTGVNGQNKGKFFSFDTRDSSGVNVSVFHASVKGGNDVAWYNYFAKYPGGVQYDGTVDTSTNGLHATLKDATNLYNASYTTFCYALTTTISGHVFLDNNGDGTLSTSGTPPDAGLNGWTVSLYNTSSSPAVLINSLTTPTTSTDAGSYQFTGVPTGSNYKVCAQPPANSGTWNQTVPSGTDCSAVSSALPAGWVFTNLQTAQTGKDFGVEQTVTPSCSTTFTSSTFGTGSGIVDYTAQLTPVPPTTGCKDAVVMYSYLDSAGKPYATIRPPASSTNTNQYWVVERIRWKVDAGGSQNPVTLKYSDMPPYTTFRTMKMCMKDPRASEFAVDPDKVSGVMPSGETTCEIQSTDFPSLNTYDYEAYVFSTVDGIKTPT